MKKLDVLAAILVVVGALNWGLVAVARFDLVAAIFGPENPERSAGTAKAVDGEAGCGVPAHGATASLTWA